MLNRSGLALLAWAGLFAACQMPPPPGPSENDPSEIRKKVDYLNNRMNKLESSFDKLSRQIEESDKLSRQARADQSVLNEDLRTELRNIQGSLDVLKHDLTEYSETNKKVKQDFDVRLADMETKVSHIESAPPMAVAPVAPVKGAKGTGGRSSVDDITRYNQILRVFWDKKYDSAIPQFQEFIKSYPESSLTANAQYWIGEGYYAQREFGKSISEFQKVVDKYPKSEKVCDSILKQGNAFTELKDTDNARLFFTEVTKRCPKTKSATLANERLRELSPSSGKK